MESISVTMPRKKISINRLFLIGNGFDLSLGFKTRYTDFLLWLLKKEIGKAINSGIRIAPIEKYKGRYSEFLRESEPVKVYGYTENKLFDILIKTGSINNLEEKIEAFQDLSSLFLASILRFLKTSQS